MHCSALFANHEDSFLSTAGNDAVIFMMGVYVYLHMGL